MKSVIASLVAVAGMSVAANAVVNTQVTWQVSLDGNTWGSQVTAAAGQQVMARALVSYTGTATALGLASMVFQPTVSNALASDTFSAFINGGIGSNTSTPLGVISGSQLTDTTSFGRVSPWGRSATASSSAIRGFFHSNPNGDNINYLRVAQAQTTSWIGGAGNTTGGSGVNIAQLSNVGRTASDPAFNPSLQNIYVFKYGFTLGAGHTADMIVDSPLAGFGNRNTSTGDREVYWWADMNESSGSNRGTAAVTTATVHVPTPASLALLGLGGLCVGRRRR
jgi:MYXO-CTERM domain-containing protein